MLTSSHNHTPPKVSPRASSETVARPTNNNPRVVTPATTTTWPLRHPRPPCHLNWPPGSTFPARTHLERTQAVDPHAKL
ncbi:hypothetical protein PTTG_07814, partial [Puccinia triticina 1-1 BBBD Race 1]